jgi:hypothetical protein
VLLVLSGAVFGLSGPVVRSWLIQLSWNVLFGCVIGVELNRLSGVVVFGWLSEVGPLLFCGGLVCVGVGARWSVIGELIGPVPGIEVLFCPVAPGCVIGPGFMIYSCGMLACVEETVDSLLRKNNREKKPGLAGSE